MVAYRHELVGAEGHARSLLDHVSAAKGGNLTPPERGTGSSDTTAVADADGDSAAADVDAMVGSTDRDGAEPDDPVDCEGVDEHELRTADSPIASANVGRRVMRLIFMRPCCHGALRWHCGSVAPFDLSESERSSRCGLDQSGTPVRWVELDSGASVDGRPRQTVRVVGKAAASVRSVFESPLSPILGMRCVVTER